MHSGTITGQAIDFALFLCKMLLASMILVGAVIVGMDIERHSTQAELNRAQDLCGDGVVGNQNGQWLCFKEHPNVKQWRPRWSAGVLVL